MTDDESTSLCAIFAELAEEQLRSDDPDMEIVYNNLDRIKKHCSQMPTPAGETPDHLEQFQFEAED